MKNSKFDTRLKYLSAMVVGLLFAQIAGAVHPMLGVLAFIAFATGPKWAAKIPGYSMGILGTTPPPAEKTAEEKLLELFREELKQIIAGERLTTEDRIKHIETKVEAIMKGEAAKENEEMEKLKGEIADLAATLKANNEGNQGGAFGVNLKESTRSIAQAFMKAYNEGVKKGEIAEIQKGTKKIFRIETTIGKAAGTITTSNITPVGTSAIPFTLADIEPGFTRVVRRRPFILSLVNLGRTNKMYVQWIEQANPDPGAAGTTGQGSAKTQTDFDLVEKSAKVEKITAYIKVSKEMLDDVGFIESEINNELIELIRLKMDEQVLSGDGVSPNLNGILTVATAFAAGNFANAIADANIFDVLRVAINQITNANFMPTDIVMHPEDIAQMDLTKDSEGRYLLPPFTTNQNNTVKGLPITANTGVTQGTFLVGDFSKSNVRVREDLVLQVGHENDDFTKNLVTILGEMRGVHYIKTNHLSAFVKGTFSTAITAIAKP